jgi:hypothetical protein
VVCLWGILVFQPCFLCFLVFLSFLGDFFDPWVLIVSLSFLCRFCIVSSSFFVSRCFWVSFLTSCILGWSRLRKVGVKRERRLECGGRNKVKALWVRVEGPASDVNCLLSRRGGEANTCLVWHATIHQNNSTMFADIAGLNDAYRQR